MQTKLISFRYIVKLLGACTHPEIDAAVLVMEFMEGGTLNQLLHSDEPLSWEERLQMLEDIVWGVKELHSHHPQVFCRNILKNLTWI